MVGESHLNYNEILKNLQIGLLRSDSRLRSLIILLDIIYTRKQKPIRLTQRCTKYRNFV